MHTQFPRHILFKNSYVKDSGWTTTGHSGLDLETQLYYTYCDGDWTTSQPVE